MRERDEPDADGEARRSPVEDERRKSPDVDEDVHRGDGEPDDEARLVNPDPGPGPFPAGEEVDTGGEHDGRRGDQQQVRARA